MLQVIHPLYRRVFATVTMRIFAFLNIEDAFLLNATVGVHRDFFSMGNVDILFIFFRLLTMQMDVHKMLYPFYIIKKMPYITATVTKIALRWQQYFFTHASFHTV